MFTRTRALLASLIIVLTGATLDRLQAGCDNDCRMKTMHYYCPGPGDAIAKPCVLFVYETCLNCEPGLSVACDNTNPSYGSECAPATVHPTTGYYKYQFCDTVCSCGSVAIVEANNMSGEHDYYASITRYNCVPGTAQP